MGLNTTTGVASGYGVESGHVENSWLYVDLDDVRDVVTRGGVENQRLKGKRQKAKIRSRNESEIATSGRGLLAMTP